MINLTELRKVFSDKLIKTDSFDEAFAKIVWVAYKQGIADGGEWNEKRQDIIGQNGNEGLHYETE